MKTTFIGSPYGKKLTKTISPTETQPYPHIRQLNSFEYEIENSLAGLHKKAYLLEDHASHGHALAKGNYERILEKESRAGLCLIRNSTESLILDIDNLVIENIPIPRSLDKNTMAILAEKFIEILPKDFRNVSYILQASASMGLKKGLNLHIEFFLSEPTSPRFLKDLLLYLNLNTPTLAKNAQLASSGTSLRYKLDPSVADNSKILYIAPPIFVDILDPFPSLEDRIQVIVKDAHQLSIGKYKNIALPEKNKQENVNLVNEIRTNAGLPKKTGKIKSIKIDGRIEDVIANPDEIRMNFVKEDGDFLRFNVDRYGEEPGDSCAYYAYKSNPNIVFNFKGEPPFLFAEADKEVYNWVITNFQSNEEVDETNDGGKPLIFNDLRTDKLYKATYNAIHNRFINIFPAKRENINDWYADHGFPAPDIIPQFIYAYLPPHPEGIDPETRIANAFIASDYMRNAPQIEIGPRNLAFSYFKEDLESICPVITKITYHALGSNDDAFERFINWLAYITQTRSKARTAWVLHGTEGTGKGILFSEILSPLLGKSNCSEKQLKDIEDNFNTWASDSLLVMLDDFSIRDSKTPESIEAKLKHLITEVNTTQRAMHTEQMNAESYVNLIITSNKYTVVPIPHDDRRYNVAPRQETKLLIKYPNIIDEKETAIPEELPYFAAYLLKTSVNKNCIKHAWDNSAKRLLQSTSRNTIEEFIDNFRIGNLEYFASVLEEHPVSPDEISYKLAIDTVLKNSIRYAKEEVGYRVSDLTLIYNYIHRKRMAPKAFSKMMEHQNFRTQRRKRRVMNDGEIRQAVLYITKWDIDDIKLQQMRQAYLGELPETPESIEFEDMFPDQI